MNDFMLGVNYWASHAGVDMWKDWKEEVVERDLETLSQNGVEVLRVFPNWRDFQPVEPYFGGGHRLREYRMADGSLPENPCYLAEGMLRRFERFCRIAREKGLKLIVGLITGWMSGRLFVPPALYEKNIFTDPAALFLQQLFLKGFVERMKKEESICAWDLGNECNCMDEAKTREAAYSWSAMVVNAIRACDSTRPVISGMHSLETDGVWNIQDQGELTDILTTHPYPFWVEHCHFAPAADFRTLLHATAQTRYYASVGKKPCLVEEIGTMGPMVCSEEKAAGFLKANLWSNWADGAAGLLWWCAHDQSLLTAAPYDWNMCERELGMLDIRMQPKPALREMKAFGEELKALGLDLPYRETDGVCILSKGQDHWGVAYMTYLLAKQAQLTLDFAWCEQELPDSGLYFLPSAHMEVMSRRSYDALKKKVFEGAVLYISLNDGILTEFEELTGFQVQHSRRAPDQGGVDWEGSLINYRRPYQVLLRATRAEVLLEDTDGNPLFGTVRYGKGRVYVLNFPLEEMLLTQEQGFEEDYYHFYKTVSRDIVERRGISRRNHFTGITIHKGTAEDYAVLVNYTAEEQDPGIEVGSAYSGVRLLHGNGDRIEPFGAAVLGLSKGNAAPCQSD